MNRFPDIIVRDDIFCPITKNGRVWLRQNGCIDSNVCSDDDLKSKRIRFIGGDPVTFAQEAILDGIAVKFD